jgi:hypothetical protein
VVRQSGAVAKGDISRLGSGVVDVNFNLWGCHHNFWAHFWGMCSGPHAAPVRSGSTGMFHSFSSHSGM